MSFSFGEGKAKVSKAKRSLRKVEVEGMPDCVPIDANTALVEEIQSKVYDTAKSRMLTFLEMLVGCDSKIDGQAAARLLNYLMQDIEDVVWQVAEKHGVDVSRLAIEKAREERRLRENIERVKRVDWRITELRQELEALERQKDRIERGNLASEICDLMERAETETLREIVNAFKRL